MNEEKNKKEEYERYEQDFFCVWFMNDRKIISLLHCFYLLISSFKIYFIKMIILYVRDLIIKLNIKTTFWILILIGIKVWFILNKNISRKKYEYKYEHEYIYWNIKIINIKIYMNIKMDINMNINMNIN